MRLAVIADTHIKLGPRFAEGIRLLDWIANDAASRGCSGWVHTGDVFDAKSLPLERDAAAAWVQKMGRQLGPGVIVRGNHDALDDLLVLERLDTARNAVHVVQDARVVDVAGAHVACLAWPQRGRLAAMLPDRSKEEVEQAAGDALRAVLRGLGQQLEACPENGPRLFAGHVMVRGSRTSVGQPLVGCDFELGLEDLALVGPADAFLLGHIHKAQDWDVAGAPAIYPGSHRRTAFGELEPKGYVVIEHDQHGLRWEFVEAPATPMLQFEFTYVDEACLFLDDGRQVHENELVACAGAEVRVRYHVRDDRREAARLAFDEIAATITELGAVSVKVEEVVESSTRSRTPEVARAVTLSGKIEALWAAKGFDPGERRESLLGKLGTVEEEARNVA